MGIRDDRKAATRGEIQRATLDLLETAGFEATTVARIADRAGISERTFFRYFDSKESAAMPGQGELVQALLAHALHPALTPAQILHELIEVCRMHFAYEVEQQEFLRISRLVLREPGLLQGVARQELQLVTALRDSLVERKLLDQMRALLVAELIACTWRVAWQCFSQEESAGRDCDPAALFEKAVTSLGEIVSPVTGSPA